MSLYLMVYVDYYGSLLDVQIFTYRVLRLSTFAKAAFLYFTYVVYLD